MIRFHLKAFILPAAFGMLGLLAACQVTPETTHTTPAAAQPPTDVPSTAQPAITAHVVTTSPPASLDPALVSLSDATGLDLVENLYIGLTQLDPAANGIVPALAATWTVSSDGLRWNFMLRDDVMWTAFDPATNEVTALRPVVAADVVYAVQRACHPSTRAPHAVSLFVIRGCREINNTDPALITEETLAQTIGVQAVNPTSLSVELEENTAHFLTLTALPILRPVAREAFAEEGAEWREAGLNASSGSWVIETYTPGEEVTLVANPEWPFAREGNATAIEVLFVSDEIQATTLLAAGEAHIAPLPGEAAQNASSLMAQPRVTFLAFAADQFPMDDAHVRRALAAAIDRQRIVDEVLGGDGLAMVGFAPPGTVGAPVGVAPPSYDPGSAQEEIAAAGYPNCQLFPRVTLLTDKSARSKALAQAVIQMWQDTLGCNDTRFDLQWDNLNVVFGYASTPLAADWQTRPHIYVLTWQADYPDANNWWGDLLHCEHGYLQLGRACGAADDLIERAAEEQDPTARTMLYAEIEALFFGSQDGQGQQVEALQPIAPLYTDVQPFATEQLTVPVDAYGLLCSPTHYDRWQVNSTWP